MAGEMQPMSPTSNVLLIAALMTGVVSSLRPFRSASGAAQLRLIAAGKPGDSCGANCRLMRVGSENSTPPRRIRLKARVDHAN